jgi:carboxymethylenebutenolidase
MPENPRNPSDLGALFDAHVAREFVDRDVHATMETMVPEPYVYNVPSTIGRTGRLFIMHLAAKEFDAFTASTLLTKSRRTQK